MYTYMLMHAPCPPNRKRIHVKLVEKMGLFCAVKHVIMRTIQSACFRHLKFLFLATGDALNVYVSLFE